MAPASRCRRQPRPAGVDHPSRRAAEERGLLNLSGGGTHGGERRSVPLDMSIERLRGASVIEKLHLELASSMPALLVGCALLTRGVGAPPAGGGCEPDHHGDHPAQRRALLDTSERSPAVPAKRRRLDRFVATGARRPQWQLKSAKLRMETNGVHAQFGGVRASPNQPGPGPNKHPEEGQRTN